MEPHNPQTSDAPTAPKAFLTYLDAVLALERFTREFADLKSITLEALEAFLNQREGLIRAAEESKIPLSDAQEEQLQAVLTKLSACDQQVGEKIQKLKDQQGKQMRELVKNRQQLSAYQFPVVNVSTGVSGEG